MIHESYYEVRNFVRNIATLWHLPEAINPSPRNRQVTRHRALASVGRAVTLIVECFMIVLAV